MSATSGTGEEALTGRPRWKNYPEAIKFILRRTIPEHPIPRGKYRQLYPQVAKEVNDRFDFGERKADAKGIKYVTEKYGSDPVFGNRKMQVVHPAKGKASTREKKTLMRAKRAVDNGGGHLILCPHCEGNGFLDVRDTVDEDDELQQSQGMASDHPSPTNCGGYGAIHPGPVNPLIGANSYQNLQPPVGGPGFIMPPSPMARVPEVYHGSSQPGQIPQPVPQYQLLSTAAPAMGNNVAYDSAQNALNPNQMPQTNGIWNGMGDMIGGGLQNGSSFNLDGREVQTGFIPPTSQPGWQNAMAVNTNATIQPRNGQIQQRECMPRTVPSIHIDPALQTGMVNKPSSTGGGNAAARTPGSGLQPRPNNQPEEKGPNNVGGNTCSYGNSLAGNQTTLAQPGTAADSHPSEPVPAADANVNYLPGNFSFENAGYNYGLDSAWLNQPLTGSSNNVGGNQNTTVDKDFSFLEYLNENDEIFNV